MYRLFFVAFLLICGLSIAGIDYFNQVQKAETTFAEFGLGDYVNNVTTRFGDQKQAMADANRRSALRSKPMKDLLPDAPAGWSRRGWTDADNALLNPGKYKGDDLPDALRDNAQLQAMMAMDRAATARGESREIYVYERGKDIVALRLNFTRAQPGGPTGMAMAIVTGNIEAMSGKSGFGVFHGVAFREELGMFGSGRDAAGASGLRIFTAKMGSQVRLTARTRASDLAVRSLLGAIDYDTLNFLLDQPLPNVGTKAPVLSPQEEKALADAAVEAASRAQIEAGQDMERRLRGIGGDLRGQPETAPSEGGAPDLAALLAAAQAAEKEAARLAAAEAAAPTETEKKPGFLSRIFGSMRTAEPEPEPPTPATIKVNRRGSSSSNSGCTTTSGFKRCSVGD